MPRRKKLLTEDEAIPANGRQHTKPCSDCPMRRDALKGWLGTFTPESWLRMLHADGMVNCHVLEGAQCAGAAIYRTNVCKRVELPVLSLPRDTTRVFATPMEFIGHHKELEGEAAVAATRTAFTAPLEELMTRKKRK